MVINNLISEIKTFAEDSLKNLDYLQTGKTSSFRAPKVVEGWLDFKTAEKEDFPYVIVRPINGRIFAPETGQKALRVDATTHRVQVLFLIGTFAKDLQGYKDCINILQRLMQSLYELPGRTLNKRYRLVEELSWNTQDESTWPQWICALIATFEIPVPQGGFSIF